MANEELKDKLKESIASGYKRDEIEIIKKNSSGIDRYSLNKELRVCAYCRVSTDNIEQTTSYEFQRQEYTEKIATQEKWIMVGIYADEGISGTSMLHRDSFNKMIEDCKKHLIDLILVKSVSRFARNVVDCLSTVEMLQELNPPVRVIFETDNIDTAKSDSMMLLQIMAMLAEGESRNKSEIMKWSYNHRNSIGRFMTPRLFGYEIDKDLPEKYRIVPEEAEVIRLVFSMYSLGMTSKEIAEIMQSAGKISNFKHECYWNANVVNNILDNERRCGELLASKTVTISFKTHKSIKNGPDVEFGPNQYFVKEHHDPIVPIDMFDHVNKMREAKRNENLEGSFPTMMVIKTGILRGFVSVRIKYTGFDYEDYLSASDFAYEGSQRNIEKIANPEIKKGDFSHFDLDGFELLDTHLMLSGEIPMMRISSTELAFNKSCFNKLEEAEAIELLYEPHENLIAIRPCDIDHPNAIIWSKNKDDKVTMKSLKSYGLSKLLYEYNGWRDDFRIKVIGNKSSKADDSIIVFELKAAEATVRFVDDNGQVTYKNAYNEHLINHFGEDYYQHKFSNRMYLMNLIKKWDLGASLESVNSDPEWMKDAKLLVNDFMSNIKESNQNA